MSITPSTSVLQSTGDTSMRLDDADLYLTQVNREHRIPLKAIAEVHAEGRALAITLKARWEDEPAVFRIGDVDEDEAAAFARDVTGVLPETGEEGRDVNGASIVVSRDISAEDNERKGSDGARIGAIVTLLVIAGLATYAGIMGGVWAVLAVVIMGCVTGFFLAAALVHVPSTALAWSLPKRGLKAVATFSHIAGYRRLHLYVDRDGNTRAFNGMSSSASAWAPKDIEIIYDPLDPRTALRADEGRWGKVIGLSILGALTSLALAGTLLLTLGYGL